MDELAILQRRVDSLATIDGEDSWRSSLSADGVLWVSDPRGLIDAEMSIAISNPTIWLHIISLKVSCFVWRACLDRIPTVVALSRINVSISSSACQNCVLGVDEVNHILVNCSFAAATLKKIIDWCKVSFQPFSMVRDLVSFAAH